jgi:hypothetical protein
MGKDYIRIWTEKNIEDIENHLLIAGDLHGDCAHCREVGLDYVTAKTCPHCHTEFHYISSRNAIGEGDHRFHVVKQIFAKRQDLIFIDYDDYKRISGRNKAKKFFQ